MNQKTNIQAIVQADHADPFSYLGPHSSEVGTALEIRTFQPDAQSVEVVDAATGEVLAAADKAHLAGFFIARIEGRTEHFPYRLRVDWNGETVEIEDPYRFDSLFGELDLHLLAEGTHLDSYRKMGAHPATVDGVEGTSFAVWAPSAKRVSVVGDFNLWDGRRHPMRAHPGCGVWEIFIPGVHRGARYKFEIKGADGTVLPLKADPYGLASELPPDTASVVEGLHDYPWKDTKWMKGRGKRNRHDSPMSVYEVHLGSWRRKFDEGNRFLTYRELAEELVPYVKDLGFTHIELLPVSEFPFDGSWGYQPIGLYAPTSRFGTPDDFKAFVDACHQAGIGVIVDWVPGHFPTDEHGLGWFDGTNLYEHADPRQGKHMDWGTLIYNYGRTEVANYLLSNALFWLDQFHIDGLRVDAVASMLYLDYSREDGEWIPNKYGGNENLEAIDFLRRLNELVYERHPTAFTVAEESTAWPMVSRPTDAGGLGFGFKWNLGWMHDTLRYMGKEPVHRQYHQNDLTFGLLYAFQENFVLPLSHDEVVHGKGSILGRMPGDEWQRFANLRAYYGFMFGHPGKKLLFMGAEIAQGPEWQHDQSIEWHLLDYAHHKGVQSLVRRLNTVVAETPALHEKDFDGDGFEWIDASDAGSSVLSFVRKGKDPDDFVLVVSNFTPVVRENYDIGVPRGGTYTEVLNTDDSAFDGSGQVNAGPIEAKEQETHGRPYAVTLKLPPLGTLYLRPSPKKKARATKGGKKT